MATTITLTYKDKSYTLEYTKRTVQMLESNGFSIRDLADGRNRISLLEQLFAGAFMAHHSRDVKPALVEELLAHVKNKDDLFATLVTMYQEPGEAFMAEPDEDDEGNATWEAKS